MRFLTLTGVLMAGLVNAASAQDEGPKLESARDKASYQIGFQIGSNIKRQGLDLDAKVLAEGVAAALAGKKSIVTPQEAEAAFAAMDAELQKKRDEKAKMNLDAGKKYLEENKAKEGVKVTKSGLQYKVIKEGTGAAPKKTSKVSTHYRGTLIDGTVFDSSYEGEVPTDNEEPVSFGVTQVIPGWTEALQLMKVGSKYRLYIPSELAYGENGPPTIGPNSVLIFDLELIDSVDETPLK
ncbi:MAG: FKBP-type peptidyl-prolyl cis-trans isomerase [Planctomyces sp.]|nr:FKBP-type peptidyl-prolyl cis-trans isomerase [Planctomyces sp.]